MFSILYIIYCKIEVWSNRQDSKYWSKTAKQSIIKLNICASFFGFLFFHKFSFQIALIVSLITKHSVFWLNQLLKYLVRSQTLVKKQKLTILKTFFAILTNINFSAFIDIKLLFYIYKICFKIFPQKINILISLNFYKRCNQVN